MPRRITIILGLLTIVVLALVAADLVVHLVHVLEPAHHATRGARFGE